MKRIPLSFFLLLSAILFNSAFAASAIERFPKGDPDELCGSAFETEGISDLNRAFGGLWLNRDLEACNALLRSAYDEMMGDETAMTPEIADEKAKWQMRTWVRIYYLFSSQGTARGGRLDTVNEGRVEDLLWNYALAKSTIARAQLDYVWFIQGSENHDVMDLANAFLAAQALKALPAYRDRALSDGQSLAAHSAAWTTYYTRYCEERVRHGLFVEIASPTYGKYMIPELTMLAEFAEDGALKNKMTALLDVTWADWAIEQLGGVRGGAKTRCYQGKYSRRGATDSWRMMGQLLLAQGNWADARVGGHPIHGFNLILSTSPYQVPRVVAELALNPEGRGEYAYISRRPGKMSAPEALPPLGGHPCYYFMDAANSRLVRYTWATPDYIMGSFRVDPHLSESTRIEAGKKAEAEQLYAAISGQNRWQGITFATGVDARVFPQCVGHAAKDKKHLTITEIQQVAVQHENVLIVQANRADKYNQAMRIYFAPGMRERLKEKDGILFLQEGNSYLAVRALSRDDGAIPCGASWDEDGLLRLDDLYAPVIFITGRKALFPTLEKFQAYVQAHDGTMRAGVLRYGFQDAARAATVLSLFANEQRLPEINGHPIDLAPNLGMHSPYVQSIFGSGQVALTFKGKTANIDVFAPER
jgi:hypothetical protein